ncbi:MAG: HAD family phosphatase [Candidatus Micrarchaeota archaeon]
MISTIIFDWGGVFTKGKHSRGIEKVLKQKYKAKIDYLFACKLFDKMDCNELSVVQLTKIINKKFKIKLTPAQMENVFRDAIFPNAQMLKLAAKLKKKYRLILLSNNNIPTVKALRAGHKKFLKLFNAVYFSNELNCRKPGKKIFQIVIKRSKLKASECVFVDDVAKNVETARKLKINAIQFKNVLQVKKQLAKLGVV